MKHSKLAKLIVAIVASVAIGAPSIILADDTSGLKGRAVKVDTTGLDLGKEPGVRILYRRLQHASKTACGVEPVRNAGSVSVKSSANRCYRQTLTAVVKEFDNEILTRIHEG